MIGISKLKLFAKLEFGDHVEIPANISLLVQRQEVVIDAAPCQPAAQLHIVAEIAIHTNQSAPALRDAAADIEIATFQDTVPLVDNVTVNTANTEPGLAGEEVRAVTSLSHFTGAEAILGTNGTSIGCLECTVE